MHRGLVFVLVGPSGVGKNAIMRSALEQVEDLRQLPTATTRGARPDEQEGSQHFFHTEESFVQLIEEDALLEWQWVHDNRYGIIRETIDTAIAQENDLVADIEVLGASILKSEYPHNAVLVFVSPPTIEALEERIRNRGADDEARIARRLQRMPFEMKHAAMCDYLIVNDDLDQATAEFLSIVFSERSRRNIRRTQAVAIFRNGERVLASAASRAYPITTIGEDERAEDAVARLAASVGVTEYVIPPNPQAPKDGIAPSQIDIINAPHQVVVRMTFDCLVEQRTEPPTGWVWQPSDM